MCLRTVTLHSGAGDDDGSPFVEIDASSVNSNEDASMMCVDLSSDKCNDIPV